MTESTIPVLTVPVRRLPHGAGLPLPSHQTDLSAGCDFLAAIDEDVVLEPGKFAVIPTGLSFALPPGYEAQIRPRSGLAARHGVTVLNAPSTIDADYRGEVGVLLINHGEAPFTIERGMRIAQMVVAAIHHVAWREVDELAPSERGAAGFGSTGLRENAG